MTAPTLTEFLLARIAEDEGRVDGISQAADLGHVIPEDWQFYIDRMASECEAKRRIVARHVIRVERDWFNPVDGPAYQEIEHYCDICDWVPDACDTVKDLAAVYADHPDYDEAWRA